MEWKPFTVNELIEAMQKDIYCFVYNEINRITYLYGRYIEFKIKSISIDKDGSVWLYPLVSSLIPIGSADEPFDSGLVGCCRSHAYHLWNIQQNNSNKIGVGPRTEEEIEKCIKDKTIVYSFVKRESTIIIIQGIVNQIDSLSKDFDFLLVDEVDEFEAKRWSLPIDRIFYTKKLVLSEIERTWK
jgi:hypothetical protein